LTKLATEYAPDQVSFVSISIGGTFMGAMGAICSSCNAAGVAAFPLAAAMTLLPLYGIELKILALALLPVSLYWTSRNVAIACKM